MNPLRFSSKQWRKITQFTSLFCVCLFLTVSCGQRTTTPGNQTGQTGGSGRITVGTTLNPRTLDPADNYELAGSNITTSLSDRLYTYKLGTDQLEPQLATALPKVSADGLTYTIPLRSGVVFHDGTAFNAEAMAFSLNRFMKNGGKPASLLTDVVESVQANGELELNIKLKKPFAAFTSLLAFSGTAPVSPKVYELGAGKFKPREFVGTGPYKLTQFNSSLIRMDVFDKYWGKKPANQGVDVQILTSSANLFNTFKTGGIDIAYQTFDPEQVSTLQQGAQAGGYQALEEKSNVVTHMIFNVTQKPLDNLAVRQALAAVVNRQIITERVYRKQAQALYSMLPDTFDSAKPVFLTTFGDGNIDKAKQLLTQAGYSATKPLQLEVAYPANSRTREQIASAMREYTTQTLQGMVQLQPKAEESAIFFANLPKGTYQIALLDWYPDFGDPDNYVQPFLSCTKGTEAKGCEDGATKGQGSFYYSDRMNKLISQQRQEQNPEARRKIFTEIQELVAKDVPAVPLVQSKDYVFAQKGIQNLQVDPILKIPFWEIKKS